MLKIIHNDQNKEVSQYEINCRYTGKGYLNYHYNFFSVERHIPCYDFCGPATHLEKRLLKENTSINLLRYACNFHDIDNLQTKHYEDEKTASTRTISSNHNVVGNMVALEF